MNPLLRWLVLIPFALFCAIATAVFATLAFAILAPEFGEVVGVAIAAWVQSVVAVILHYDLPGRAVTSVMLRASSLAGALLVAPVVITAITSELFRWRGWMAQAALTAFSSIVLPLGVLAPRRMLSGAEARVLIALGLVGVVAGSIYWLVAGRSAGEGKAPSASAS